MRYLTGEPVREVGVLGEPQLTIGSGGDEGFVVARPAALTAVFAHLARRRDPPDPVSLGEPEVPVRPDGDPPEARVVPDPPGLGYLPARRRAGDHSGPALREPQRPAGPRYDLAATEVGRDA